MGYILHLNVIEMTIISLSKNIIYVHFFAVILISIINWSSRNIKKVINGHFREIRGSHYSFPGNIKDIHFPAVVKPHCLLRPIYKIRQ